MKIDEVALQAEIDAIQARCDSTISDVDTLQRQEMLWASSQLSRVNMVRDEVKRLVTKRRAHALRTAKLADFGPKPPSFVVKDYVANECADIQFLLDRLESLRQSLVKRFEAAQSALSYSKAERQNLPPTV